MTLYRFYCLNDLSHIVGGMGLETQDDLSAIPRALQGQDHRSLARRAAGDKRGQETSLAGCHFIIGRWKTYMREYKLYA
jgi:hypothetical protein